MSLFLRPYKDFAGHVTREVWAYDIRIPRVGPWTAQKRLAGVLGAVSREEAEALYADIKRTADELTKDTRHQARLAKHEHDAGLSPRLEAFLPRYLAFYQTNRRASTVTRLEVLLRTLILPRFGTTRLGHITTEAVETFKTDLLARGYAVWTITGAITQLKAIMNRAVIWGILEKNPIKGVVRLDPPIHVRVLTDEEERRLLAKCHPRFRLVFIAALQTGLRRSELLGLSWQDVDLTNRVITIPASRYKTGFHHAVPISQSLYDLLYPLAAPPEQKVFFYKYSSIDNLMSIARRRAQIQDLRFHDLRHTFASRLLLAGVDLATVKELLGHRNIQSTMVYSHLSLEHKRKAIHTMEQHTLRQGVADSGQFQFSDAQALMNTLVQLGVVSRRLENR